MSGNNALAGKTAFVTGGAGGIGSHSAFLAVRYGAPLMEGGSIVCISSTAATLPFAYLPAYHTSKGGLENFVRAAAEELGQAGIRVNAVRPGLTRSDGTGGMIENPDI